MKILLKGIILGCAVVLLGLAVLGYFFVIKPYVDAATDNTAKEGKKEISVSIVYRDASFDIDITTYKTTVFDALLEAESELGLDIVYTVDPVYGAYISSFLGMNSFSENDSFTFYGVFVDGEMAIQGISFLNAVEGKHYTFHLLDDEYPNPNLVAFEGKTGISFDTRHSFVGTEESTTPINVPLIVMLSVIGAVVIGGVVACAILLLKTKKNENN